MTNDTEIRALQAEGRGYIATGRIERAREVNAQLEARGAKPLELPEVRKRTAASADTAARRKRGS